MIRSFIFAIATILVAMKCVAAEDPVAYLQRELKMEFSPFCYGVAEAIRMSGKEARTVGSTDYVAHSEQVSEGYKVRWATKKSEPSAPYPELIQLSKPGVILPANLIIGKSTMKDVISQLGKPDQKTGESLTYHFPGYAGDDGALFVFKNNKLASLELQWFLE